MMSDANRPLDVLQQLLRQTDEADREAAGVDKEAAATDLESVEREAEELEPEELEPEVKPEEVKPEPELAAEPAPAIAADATAEADEEEETEEDDDDFFLPGDWYVIHTYAGYENKVRANLNSRTASMNMEDKIFDVVIPTEEVMEIKGGKKQVVQKKVFPGYILVRMMLDDDSWYVVRNTPGVTGFVGPGAKPQPLSSGEVGKILASKPAERVRPRMEFQVGEVVRVVSGPFQNMSGPIADLDMDQQMVTVHVDIFGRETPVKLPFDQIAKL
jgi:transcriptional antiterminator NusG